MTRASAGLTADPGAGAGAIHADDGVDRLRGGPGLGPVIGRLPYRLALAGGWIDQPFMSRANPDPPGSMVVVSLEPTVPYMSRSGMATGTRTTAASLWGDEIPAAGSRLDLVRELYRAENEGLAEPSGSQDMIGLIYPGVSRLDYEASVEGGWFPSHIENTCDPAIAAWLERVVHLVPVGPRPPGYAPLGVKRLDPAWVRRLGRSGRDCFDAIYAQDLAAFGASMTECSAAWDAILPHTLAHPTIDIDLKGLVAHYQSRYAGAMYSGCGGGYLVVASAEEVPGSFRVSVRTQEGAAGA
jgi:hypothetical protein